jgi:hypothetical protein
MIDFSNCDFIAAEAAAAVSLKKTTCRSGRHTWIDPVSRERCCNPEWRRETRVCGEHADLDQYGRVYTDAGMVIGWAKIQGGNHA